MDLEKQTEYGSTTPEAPEAAVKSASFKLRPVAKLALVVVALCAGILFGAMMAPAGKLTSLEFSEGAVLVDPKANASVSLLCMFRWLGLSACPQIGGLTN
mmetsp:Transcript_21204/g.65208  ORF Transcript_21204/g.65208 Transcript_21204/m.65208 type:complete len:100 (+) Transcript_21204:573-872(+)